MSERGAFRGGRGGGRGGDRGGRGGGRGGHAAGGAAGQTERPKKENILDLSKYMDKRITVKFNGGREGISIPFARSFYLFFIYLFFTYTRFPHLKVATIMI